MEDKEKLIKRIEALTELIKMLEGASKMHHDFSLEKARLNNELAELLAPEQK